MGDALYLPGDKSELSSVGGEEGGDDERLASGSELWWQSSLWRQSSLLWQSSLWGSQIGPYRS